MTMTPELTPEDRFNRLDTFINEGRLIRDHWTGSDADGRETACLLAALSPEAGQHRSASECPAALMPSWLAHLTPWIDDAPSLAAWPGIVKRYANLARRWHVIDAATWDQLRFRSLALIVREGRSHTKDERVLPAIDVVLELLDKKGGGEEVTPAQFEAARKNAYAASSAAWDRYYEAAEAARAAAEAARAAEAAGAAEAAEAATDRMVNGILDVIEAAVVSAENKGGCATA